MHKKYSLRMIVCFSLLIGCKSNEKPAGKSENDIDAARNFIRAALDGKFEEARTYLLSDSVNTNWMDVAERSYQRTDDDTKRGYRSSSINIHQVSQLNDSVTVVIYSNSFKNDHDTLKILKEKGQWLVDLKYLYEHDMDTLFNKPVSKDSIK
jgi:Domain of unknown function (DUF4878)